MLSQTVRRVLIIVYQDDSTTFGFTLSIQGGPRNCRIIGSDSREWKKKKNQGQKYESTE